MSKSAITFKPILTHSDSEFGLGNKVVVNTVGNKVTGVITELMPIENDGVITLNNSISILVSSVTYIGLCKD